MACQGVQNKKELVCLQLKQNSAGLYQLQMLTEEPTSPLS